MANAPATVLGFPVELSPGAIDRELASMWKRRGGDSDDGTPGVTRVALGNVIWLGSSRHVPPTRQVFSQLVSTFPARLFILEYTGAKGDQRIRAFVNAYCFLQADKRSEVCCEEIHLQFGDDALQFVARAILPLLIPDLPTCFWYSSAYPERYNVVLDELLDIADRSVSQVSLLDDPAEGLRLLADGGKVTSMSWYTHEPIREQIATLFDDATVHPHLRKISAVRFTWQGRKGDNEGPVHAALLAGWMASCLGWTPGEPGDNGYRYQTESGSCLVQIEKVPPQRASEVAEILCIEIHTQDGDCFRLSGTEDQGSMSREVEMLSSSCAHRSRIVHAAPLGYAEALARAMNSRVDRRFFREAARLAAPLLQDSLKRNPT